MEDKMQLAVLIDADNISSQYAHAIFNELEKYGFASCRRIYGNWSKESSWKESVLLEYSIIPIQQFSYTSGKNSTDMVMVIDAMDLLHQNKVDGFCLVTSDSDFTRLAMRLREENKYVIGMGESKTPKALTRACNKFIHLNLISDMERGNSESSVIDAEEHNITKVKDLELDIVSMINESSKGRLELGIIGNRLSEKYPDFDVRNYGYSKLSVFIDEGMSKICLLREGRHYFVIKQETIKREDIRQEIITIIKKNHGSINNLSIIYGELKKCYQDFDLHDYGYSRLSSFLRSMDCFIVENNSVKLKRNDKKS